MIIIKGELTTRGETEECHSSTGWEHFELFHEADFDS